MAWAKRFHDIWVCRCSWWCLLDNLLFCRVRSVCDRHDEAITAGRRLWRGVG